MEPQKTSLEPASNQNAGSPADAKPPPYRYVPVNQFTPLENTDWFALTTVTGRTLDPKNPWRTFLRVGSNNRGTRAEGYTYIVAVEMVSYSNNIFRIRIDPSNLSGPPSEISFGPVKDAYLTTIRENEIGAGAPSEGTFNFDNGTLTFNTEDLLVTIDKDFYMTVKDKASGVVIHQDARDSNGYSLGATFVDPINQGPAFATVKMNNKDNTSINERFYGQGEINVLIPKTDGDYTLSKTGLSMTNFNYDQIGYNHSELLPEDFGLNEGIPNYYFPMYFSAPWLVVVGNQGQDNQYAYGLFLNNPSQSYANTGDPNLDCGDPKAFYLGAQAGELDYFFVGTAAQNPVSAGYQVGNVTIGLSYLCSDPNQDLEKHAAMPPKYIFGFFQGVYGATSVTKAAFPDRGNIENNISFEEILDKYNENNIPLEGFAVDIDVQETYKVFTINDRFIEKGKAIFEWARENNLVTQTNITCFVKDSDPSYDVYTDLVNNNYYTTRDRADGGVFPIPHDANPPDEAYHTRLSYGASAKATAMFPDWGKKGVAGKPSVAEWWGGRYEKLFKLGLDFVWQDMTTPSAAPHMIGNELSNEHFPEDTIKKANGKTEDDNARAQAADFNWRSYHSQALVTDPRFDDGKKKSFVETRNQHAYSLCSATYLKGIKPPSTDRKFQRSYVIARGGQIGSQHFGGLWMGDNVTNWPYLRMMIPMITSMNMSGVSVVGADIGGFAGVDGDSRGESSAATPELLTRWVQAGCLLPWFRNHYDRWISLDPSTGETEDQWQPKGHGKPYQEVSNDAYDVPASDTASCRDVMRTAIELRYRWQEILYTAAYQHVKYGRPMINPMCNWPKDPGINYDEQICLNQQFLLGPNLEILVAPATDKTTISRDVYLPSGASWFLFGPELDDADMGGYHSGGEKISTIADLSTMPIYVRKGSKLPTRYTIDGKNKSINAYTKYDPLVFDIFSVVGTGEGPTNGFVYLDDGGATTQAEEQGIYSCLYLSENKKAATDKSAEFILNYDKNNYVWGSAVYLRLREVGAVTSVTINGVNVTGVKANDKYDFFKGSITTANYWQESPNSGSLWIRVPQPSATSPTSIVVTCSDTIDRSAEQTTP